MGFFESIGAFFASLPSELYVFLISILPIIELRGAIPVGAALSVPFYINYPLSIIGNLLPVPFILLFIPKILDFMARFKIFRPVVEWLRKKADKNSSKIIKTDSDLENEKSEETEGASSPGKKRLNAGIFTALLLFVAIPLPGTGAWTGGLVASLFNLPKRSSFLAITLGVLLCGVIMCLASYGVLGFLNFLL